MPLKLVTAALALPRTTPAPVETST